MTDETAPRRHRIGIFAPFVLVVLAFAAWSGYWFYVANQIETRFKAHQDALIGQGYQVSLDPWHVGGYPFRMFVQLHNVTVIAPSGRGVAAPQIEAEANAYALDKWVLAAPQGLTLYRGHPGGIDLGTVMVAGSGLKASVSSLTQPIYNVAVSGQNLVLTPSDTAHPFAFSTAGNFEAYLRPTPDKADSADVLLRVADAHGQPQSIAGDLSPEKPLALHVEATLSHVSAFGGAAQGQAVAQWRAAGGTVSGFKAQATAGDLNVFAKSDALTVGDDNRLAGHMDIEMSGSFQPINVLAALRLISPENMTLAKPLLNLTLATQGTQKFPLDFRDGGAFIGPLKVSDAPILP